MAILIKPSLAHIGHWVYFVFWVAFTFSMTRPGVNFFMTCLDSGLGCTKATSFVILLGVNSLVGLVLGAFASWSILEVYLGFPIPYAPILVTVVIDLAFCYSIKACYDCDKDSIEYEEEEDSDDECLTW
jgi:hypothetical protein